jgi:hypothetical protein
MHGDEARHSSDNKRGVAYLVISMNLVFDLSPSVSIAHKHIVSEHSEYLGTSYKISALVMLRIDVATRRNYIFDNRRKPPDKAPLIVEFGDGSLSAVYEIASQPWRSGQQS